MSVVPNSVRLMMQADRNQERESFHRFFECWIVEQNQYLQELVHISKEHEEDLRALVESVVHHYENYYTAKSSWAKIDILSMFNPAWLSTLEDAYLWIGGWRPTMAVHLLYSKSGLQLETQLDERIRGLRTGDLGDLSWSQLEKVDLLQRETIKEEKEITEKLARQQEKVADASMVELSHLVTEMIREGADQAERVMADGRVDVTLAPKEKGMVSVLQMADDLRLKTLKKVIDILSPIQGVYFLIAAAELHLRVHEWGKKRDANNQVGHGQEE